MRRVERFEAYGRAWGLILLWIFLSTPDRIEAALIAFIAINVGYHLHEHVSDQEAKLARAGTRE